MLLILALLFTIIEGARVSTAKVFAERAMTTAMDSVFAEYYGPLWEEYHIFGYNTDNESSVEKKKQIEDKLSEYMSYTFTPNKSQDTSLYNEGIDLYDLALNSISVNNQTQLMDYNGELVIHEAVEYMKYQELGDGLELLLEKMSLLETPKKVSAIYDDKSEVEEELVEIDKGVLQLMELLDGIKTSNTGIELGDGDGLQTTQYFIKQICFDTATEETVGINNENVFLVLKDKYVNPIPLIESMENSALQLEGITKRIEEINKQQEGVSKALQNAQALRNAYNASGSKSAKKKNQVKAMSDNIQNNINQSEELEKQKREQETIKNQLLASIDTIMNSLQMLINEVTPLIQSAISITDGLQYKAGIAGDLLSEYEEALEKQKEYLGEDIFEGLEDSLKEMKRYTTSYNSGYDFIEMTDELECDFAILTEVKGYLDQGEAKLEGNQYQAFITDLKDAERELTNYETGELTLDYSTLVLDQSKQKNPMEEVNNLLQSGITNLVIDSSALSDKELTQEQLPSVSAALSSDNADTTSMIKTYFENSIISNDNDGRSDLFYNFQDTTQRMTELGDGISQIAEVVLYQKYLKKHFECFLMEGEDTSARKPAALSYEQEYLLLGKISDRENISSFVSRIVFVRMMLDFASILGDKAKCTEAKLVATSLVGFTGLPILISITQTVILLVWSFMEALLDTCALIMGKEVPIIKKKIVLEFPELFLINRSFLKSKASQSSQSEELSFAYQDYLSVFLLTKDKEELAYRSMDLMQENINLRYEDKFYYENCIYGLQAEADFLVDSKFTGFSFVQEYLDNMVDCFRFSAKSNYSY